MRLRQLLPYIARSLCALVLACGPSQTAGTAASAVRDTLMSTVDWRETFRDEATVDRLASLYANNRLAMVAFLDSLPIDSADGGTRLAPKGDPTEWAPLLSKGAERDLRHLAALAGAPRFGLYLQRPILLNGREIQERQNPVSDGSIGEADCTKDGEPLVLYDPVGARRFQPMMMVFFRAHEFAHLLRGHVQCRRGENRKDVGYDQELQADCTAAQLLAAKPDGQVIVGIAVTLFRLDGTRDSRTHPSSVKRADQLWSAECSRPLLDPGFYHGWPVQP